MSQAPKKARKVVGIPTLDDAAMATRLNERRLMHFQHLQALTDQPDHVPVGIITTTANANLADVTMPRRAIKAGLMLCIREDEQQLASLGFDFTPAPMPAYEEPAAALPEHAPYAGPLEFVSGEAGREPEA